MAPNRRMTPEVLAQQPGVVAVFVGTTAKFSEKWAYWETWQAAAEMYVKIADWYKSSTIISHIDTQRTLHLSRSGETMIVVVMETGCKFSKCVARSMRRALDSVVNPRSESPPITSDDRPAASSSKGSSW